MSWLDVPADRVQNLAFRPLDVAPGPLQAKQDPSWLDYGPEVICLSVIELVLKSDPPHLTAERSIPCLGLWNETGLLSAPLEFGPFLRVQPHAA